MQSHSSQKVKTFTIGFGDSDYDESAAAGQVAQLLGTDHTEWIVSDSDLINVVPKLAEIYDEPFADSSQIPTYLVSFLARQHVTVALSGDGGDELFGGYDRYRTLAGLRRASSSQLRHVVPVMGWLSLHGASISWEGPIAKQLRRLLPGALAVRTQQRLRKFSEVVVGDPVGLYERMMAINRHPSDFLMQKFETPNLTFDLSIHTIESAIEQAMLSDMAIYLCDDLLTKVDRASMSNSLEVRAPMLNPRIFEVAWRLPVESRSTMTEGKVALRHLLRKYLPNELIDRPKRGFGVPLAQWLRGPLRQWSDDLLSVQELQRREVWDIEQVRRAWSSHRSGEADRSVELWPVLVFQSWAARWLK